MNTERRLPTPEEAVELLKGGMLDDRILHLSDEELREALAGYRGAGQDTGEEAPSTGAPQEDRPRRSIA